MPSVRLGAVTNVPAGARLSFGGRSVRLGSQDEPEQAENLGASKSTSTKKSADVFSFDMPEQTLQPAPDVFSFAMPEPTDLDRAKRNEEIQDENRAAIEAASNPKDVNPGFGDYRLAAMGLEEFNKLDPQQQDAVRFNTLLKSAMEKDASTEGGDRAAYDAAAEHLFGETSETYAPETLALLDAMGLSSHGSSIDEYLSYKNLVNASELENLTGTVDSVYNTGIRALENSVDPRTLQLRSIVDGIREFQSQEENASALADALAGVTGVQTTAVTNSDVLDDASDDMRAIFEYSANSNNELSFDDLLATLTDAGIDYDAFFNYAGNRISRLEYEQTLNPAATSAEAEDFTMRSVTELKDLFGIVPLGGE